MPTIFNRVFINANGIYYLLKFQDVGKNNETINKIIVKYIQFDEKGITGFDDFKVENNNEDK